MNDVTDLAKIREHKRQQHVQDRIHRLLQRFWWLGPKKAIHEANMLKLLGAALLGASDYPAFVREIGLDQIRPDTTPVTKNSRHLTIVR